MFKKIIIPFLLGYSVLTWADTVVLKDGEEFTGKVVYEDEDRVHLRIDIGIIKFNQEEIDEVIQDDEGLSSEEPLPFPLSTNTVEEKPVEEQETSEAEKTLELKKQSLELKRMELELKQKELELKKAKSFPPEKESKDIAPVESQEITPPSKKEILKKELEETKEKGYLIQPKIQGTGAERYKTY